MTHIQIVLLISLCTPDALDCIQMSPSITYEDPEACEVQLAQMVSPLQGAVPSHPLVMGRCQYLDVNFDRGPQIGLPAR